MSVISFFRSCVDLNKPLTNEWRARRRSLFVGSAEYFCRRRTGSCGRPIVSLNCALQISAMLSARLSTCACGGGGVRGLVKLVGFAPRLQPAVRLLRTDSRQFAAFNQPWGDRESVVSAGNERRRLFTGRLQRKRVQNFRMTMSDEEKTQKMSEIERARSETKPTGLVAKLKFYIKRSFSKEREWIKSSFVQATGTLRFLCTRSTAAFGSVSCTWLFAGKTTG